MPAKRARTRGRQGRGSAVCGVDVEPEAVLSGEIGDAADGVDGAGRGRAGAGDYAEGQKAGGAVGGDQGFEVGEVESGSGRRSAHGGRWPRRGRAWRRPSRSRNGPPRKHRRIMAPAAWTPSRTTLTGALAERAAASAAKFAIDPPLVKSPTESFGKPRISFSQLMATCSTSAAAGPERQAVTLTLRADSTMLPMAVTGVPGRPHSRTCAGAGCGG